MNYAQRYQRSRQPAAVGSILGSRLDVAPPPKTPYQLGREAEGKVLARLRSEGYSGTLTPWSHGVFDIEVSKTPKAAADGPVVRRVQVKWHRPDQFTAWCLNDAVRDILRRTRVVEGVSREVWLWIHGKGAVVKVVIGHDDSIAVLGRGEWLVHVAGALARMVARS